MHLNFSATRHQNRYAHRIGLIIFNTLITGLLTATSFYVTAQTYPVTAEQRREAEATAATGIAITELADNAPEQYTVLDGDTLWELSAKFLKSPWRWPQLWGMNKNEINNPHLIYPGQSLVLERHGERARLRIANASEASANTVKLSPMIRSESLAEQAIPAIPAHVIEPFLSQPLIVEENALDDAPRIVATPESRVYVGSQDLAYVRGIQDKTATDYWVFRPATPLVDPDTGKVLAYEAMFLGNMKRLHSGDPATFRVTHAKQEIGIGDRLQPVTKSGALNYMPHPPEKTLKGRVVSIYGGVSQAGNNQVVAISVGTDQGVAIGDVLALYHLGKTLPDRTAKGETIKLPDEKYGVLLVFRRFEKLAYGLVMNVREPVQVGDSVANP